jgi:hypothetical protein
MGWYYAKAVRRSDAHFDKNPPSGGIFHVAGFTSGTLRVVDIWESQQAFEKFQKDRLATALQKAGVTGQPKTQFYPVHNVYVPNMEFIRKTGGTAQPSAA